MTEYAIPTDVRTILETDEVIVQVATMRCSDDAPVYARQCQKFDAWSQVKGLEVTVIYFLDSDGKIY